MSAARPTRCAPSAPPAKDDSRLRGRNAAASVKAAADKKLTRRRAVERLEQKATLADLQVQD